MVFPEMTIVTKRSFSSKSAGTRTATTSTLLPTPGCASEVTTEELGGTERNGCSAWKYPVSDNATDNGSKDSPANDTDIMLVDKVNPTTPFVFDAAASHPTNNSPRDNAGKHARNPISLHSDRRDLPGGEGESILCVIRQEEEFLLIQVNDLPIDPLPVHQDESPLLLPQLPACLGNIDAPRALTELVGRSTPEEEEQEQR
jgi:hypothetical protein